MISPFRLRANRRNALRSTGPRTDEGKERSRANALRHGLTAETIIPSLEDAEDYTAFEAAIISDYGAETAVARELVLRLASLLWRLRRATAIDTQLLDMQSEASRTNRGGTETEQLAIHQFRLSAESMRDDRAIVSHAAAFQPTQAICPSDYVDTTRQLAYSFLRLAELDPAVLERLSRYEARLWREAVQIVCVLDPIRPR